jgi:hypothetical protein
VASSWRVKPPTISNSLRLSRAPLFHGFGQIAEQKFYRMSIEQGWIDLRIIDLRIIDLRIIDLCIKRAFGPYR